MRLRVEITIERPPGVVFDFIARDHWRNHPRADPNILEMTPLEPGPIGSGAARVRRTRGVGRRGARSDRVRARRPVGEPEPDRRHHAGDDRPDRPRRAGGKPVEADRRQPGARRCALCASAARPTHSPPDARQPEARQGHGRDRNAGPVTVRTIGPRPSGPDAGSRSPSAEAADKRRKAAVIIHGPRTPACVAGANSSRPQHPRRHPSRRPPPMSFRPPTRLFHRAGPRYWGDPAQEEPP
jgi:hypothetical protein